MSATCQIPFIAFYGRSGSMLHKAGYKAGECEKIQRTGGTSHEQ
ncbi:MULTISPECIES: hypothetical protein [unclassified Microcoleus]|nr:MULTISPECIES: hypothetical protein [unclassified Microcoleus]